MQKVLCSAGAQTGGGGAKQALSGELRDSAVRPLVQWPVAFVRYRAMYSSYIKL